MSFSSKKLFSAMVIVASMLANIPPVSSLPPVHILKGEGMESLTVKGNIYYKYPLWSCSDDTYTISSTTITSQGFSRGYCQVYFVSATVYDARGKVMMECEDWVSKTDDSVFIIRINDLRDTPWDPYDDFCRVDPYRGERKLSSEESDKADKDVASPKTYTRSLRGNGNGNSGTDAIRNQPKQRITK